MKVLSCQFQNSGKKRPWKDEAVTNLLASMLLKNKLQFAIP